MADVQVTIGASLKELTQGLAEAGKLVDGFKKESMKAKEVATFLSNAISGIGGASQQAASLASNLIGGFAAGGAMGLALGGVNALIGYLKSVQEEEKKATEEAKKFLEEIRKTRTEVAALQEERKGDSVGAAYTRGGGKVEEAGREFSAASNALMALNMRAWKETFGPSQKELDAADARYEAAKEKLKQAVLESQASITKAETEHAAKRTQAIEKEDAAREAALTKAKERDKAVLDRLKAKMEQEQQESEERAQVMLKEQEIQQRAAQKQKDLEKSIQDAKNAAEDKVFEEQYEKEQAQLKDRAQIYSEWGQRIGSSLAGAVTTGMSPIKMLGTLLKDVVKAILQSAVTTITAKAGEAAAGAASSQASIPVVGPALAAGAMAAMLGMVMGLIDGLPSAAGGWETPSFGTAFPAVLHPNEVVIPAWGKQALKNMANVEGGGSSTNITITTIDGPSVDRIARDHSSSFRRALRRDERRRRS